MCINLVQNLREFLHQRFSQAAENQNFDCALDTLALTSESIPLGNEIVYIGKCHDDGDRRTIWVCMKYPNDNYEWENHLLDLVRGRADFQSAV